MIKSDFIACGTAVVAILLTVGLSIVPITVTAQNTGNVTTDILTTTKNIHNTTLPGDTILHRGIISSEEPAHLVLRSGKKNHGVEILPHRPDGATYSGILTFTATKPVEVGFGHRLHVDNSTLSQFETEKWAIFIDAIMSTVVSTSHLVSYRFHPVSYLTMESHRPISLPQFHL